MYDSINNDIFDTYRGFQYKPDNKKGHYESYYLRANHPSSPQAFWIRYTIFSPKGAPEKAIGELWCIFFDTDKNEVVAAKSEIDIVLCQFSSTNLEANIDQSYLKEDGQGGILKGNASSSGNVLSWNLRYESNGENALTLLPKSAYGAPIPKAKGLIGCPHVTFNGKIVVNGTLINIDGWRGSENHNWGSKHTDKYYWGQVAGFDNDENAFLECITSKLKLGPIWLPEITLAVLRVDGEDYSFNGLKTLVKSKANCRGFDWSFKVVRPGAILTGSFQGNPNHFVGLTYYNPPKGSNTCLNSKVAKCEIVLERKGKPTITLNTSKRAAFEILTKDTQHGIPVVA